MVTALAIRQAVTSMDIDGRNVRVVLDKELMCVGDITSAIDIASPSEWIRKLRVVSNNPNSKVIVEEYSIGEASPAVFTNIYGIYEILAGSRKPKAKVRLMALIEKLRTVPRTDFLAQAINRMTDFMERTEARLSKLESKPVVEPVLLKPVIDFSEHVRLLISDWIKAHADNPRVTYSTVHQRLNTRFLYRHKRNISEMGKNRNKSALQVAIDIGMGAELLSLAQYLVENNFEGFFNEGEEPF